MFNKKLDRILLTTAGLMLVLVVSVFIGGKFQEMLPGSAAIQFVKQDSPLISSLDEVDSRINVLEAHLEDITSENAVLSRRLSKKH